MTLWPEGSQLVIGLWLDRPVGPSGLLAVGDVLRAGGGRYNGAVMEAEAGQRFAWLGDLEGFRWDDGLTEAAVRELALIGRAYRIGMDLPVLGPVMLTFGGTPQEGAVPAERHPVTVLMESGAFGIPREIWEDEDIAEAGAMQPVVLRHLEACCRTLDPAYVMVAEEGLTPTPAGLASGTSLGLDGYVARRLIERPELREALAAVESVTNVVAWDIGTCYSGWFLTGERDRDAVSSAWTAASTVLGKILLDG